MKPMIYLIPLLVALAGCGDRGSATSVPVASAKNAAPGSAASSNTVASSTVASKTAASDPMLVTVDSELAKRLTIAAISTKAVGETIRIAGRLEVNQYKTTRVGAPITGRLSQVDALFGQQVTQGQVLAELNSQELAQAQLAFLRANSQQQLLTRAVERAQLLLAADVIGSAELQRRQSELSVAVAEKRAAGDQLRTLGLTPSRLATLERTGQIQSTASIAAPIAGTIIERKVAQGQVVNPADVLFLITDLSVLWAQAEVPEQDARFVKPGQRVQIEIPALDNERITGKVALVADVVSPETRTVRVSVDVDNSQRRLKPSMLITMLIEGKSAATPVVPVSAVVRENDRDHVFVGTSGNEYRLSAVELGPERDGVRALLKPLGDASRIVADGSFHLNNVRVQRAVSGRQ